MATEHNSVFAMQVPAGAPGVESTAGVTVVTVPRLDAFVTASSGMETVAQVLARAETLAYRCAGTPRILAATRLAGLQRSLLDAVLHSAGIAAPVCEARLHTVIVPCLSGTSVAERCASFGRAALPPQTECIVLVASRHVSVAVDALATLLAQGALAAATVLAVPVAETGQEASGVSCVRGVPCELGESSESGESSELGAYTRLCLLLAQHLARGATLSMVPEDRVCATIDTAANVATLHEQHHLACAAQKDGIGVWRAWVYQRYGIGLVTCDAAALAAYTDKIAERHNSSGLSAARPAVTSAECSDGRPLVSVIIPVYNHLQYTEQCLAAVTATCAHLPVEVIVVDNGSDDGTAQALASRSGITYIRNAENTGFTLACNQGAAAATGRYLMLLNNDTIVQPGWLDHLVNCLDHDAAVWAAGARLVYPDGGLQEAGAVVFRDGTAANFGRHDDPGLPRYNRPCPVDYCSGASLLIRADVFRTLGGLDVCYSPAYYEETDLCFAIRARGGIVAYEPASVVVHYGSTTAGLSPDSGARRFLAINKITFTKRWAHVLAGHEARPGTDEAVLTNTRDAFGQRVGTKNAVTRVATQSAAFNPALLAFYLPQYHQVPENDAWWGQGFTEWVNVRKARPGFAGHAQPLEPTELGWYDLADVEVMRQQAALAREYGVTGFCFYHYWFGGRRLLETPLEQFLTSDIDMPFCLCWANENWSRNWDGGNGEVLLAQTHSAEDDERHFACLLRFMRDPRYLRVHGKPVLLVYRAGLLPDAAATTALWRRLAAQAGLPGLHLCKVESLSAERDAPAPLGFDAAVEFQPDWRNLGEPMQAVAPSGEPDTAPPAEPVSCGNHRVFAYEAFAARQQAKIPPEYTRYPCVTPRWDNTARRAHDSVVLHQPDPEVYQIWLEHALYEAATLPQQEQFVFINAWNEWGEGCTLEPDTRFERAFLRATQAARDAVTGLLRRDVTS